MTLEDFCKFNDISKVEPFLMLGAPSLPPGEHTLDFTIVVQAMTGSLELVADGRRCSMCRRTMLVLRPGQSLEFLSRTENFRARTLIIGGDIGMELNVSGVFLAIFIAYEMPVFKITSKYADAVRMFFEAFEKVAGFEANPYRKECIMSLLRAFFYSSGYFLTQALSYTDDELFRISSQVSEFGDGVISRFISLVEENADVHRTLDFYAEMLDYNPKYLSALVKKETGYTGQKIIDQYAALKAMAKLAYSSRSIKEISNEMDFPSQSDFGKFFKRVTGRSPLEYRNWRREETRRQLL